MYCCPPSWHSFSCCTCFDPGPAPDPALIFCIRFLNLNSVRSFCFVRVISRPTEHFSVKTLFCPTVATVFYFSWECPTNLWTLPVFPELPNMAHSDLVQPMAAATTTQVKLCPYDKEEPPIWFHLIEAQFCSCGHQILKTQIHQCSRQPAQASP